MKIQKLISRGLALGILLNYTLVLSYASTEIPNRYQTLEGEYITIDDSTEGNLEEIEIFGNTVQDPNNLEDIQSVGDLYIDDEGNTILDKQGRKQYKIDLYSSKNLFREDEILSKNHNTKRTLSFDGSRIVLKNIESYNYLNEMVGTITLDKGIYTWHATNIEGTISVPYTLIELVNENYQGIKIAPSGTRTNTFEVLNDDTTFNIRIDTGGLNNQGNVFKFNIQLEKNNIKTNYEFYKNNKTEIILPCQLQKIKNVADRLYWDNIKNRYVVQKNIGDMYLKDCSHIIKNSNGGNSNSVVTMFGATLDNRGLKEKNPNIITTHTNSFRIGSEQEREFIWTINTAEIYFTIDNSKLTTHDVEGLLEYNNTKNIRFLYEVENPIIIETNITSKIKVPFCEKSTHIFIESENTSNFSLKVVIDRLPQIAKDTVESAKFDSSNYNISLARMYINMLSESLYKDQLQSQLNNIFSNEVVLEKKNATAHLDLYIKSENILQMSIDTNSITFEDFSSIEDITKENAVNISINSSLPYSINAYLPTEIQNSDKSNTMDKQILNIKENSEVAYQTFNNINEKLILKDNNPAGNNINHGIDIKLKGNIAHEKDVYKTTIKFEAQQK